jgi:hypothetical protein
MSTTNKLQQNTAKSWKASGGDFAITLTSLANAAARQGAKGDLGTPFARVYNVLFTASVGVAATNGNTIDLYWCQSTSATAGTDNPGALSGTDASAATPAELTLQLVYVGRLALSNAQGTGIQKQSFLLFPKTQYGFPVVVNSSGQTMGATAGDHTITLTPCEDVNA